jgi:hypothetical protein
MRVQHSLIQYGLNKPAWPEDTTNTSVITQYSVRVLLA